MSSKNVNRRRVLTALGTGGVVGVAGCLSSSDEDGDSDGDAGYQDGATVTLADDPTAETWGVYGGVTPYYTNILEPLVWVTDDMELEPWLATDWEAVDETSWQFTIRDGVTFHNGEPLTADAVAFSFEAVLDEWAWAPGWLHLEPEGIEVVDDRTVELTTTDPFPTFPGTIAHNMVAIQHPDRDREAKEVVGTGPFEVAEIEQEQHIRTVAFEDYWNEQSALSELTFQVVQDPNTRSLSLNNHEADVVFSPPRSRIDSLNESDETQVFKRRGTGSGYAGINIYKSPTDDLELRRAINYAVSQERIVSTILEDVGTPARGPISPEIYWSAHDDLPEHEQDKERATELVESSSYDGEELTLLVPNDMVDGREIAQVLERNFEDVGITAEILVLERAAYSDAERNGEAHLVLKERGPNSGAADYSIYESFHSDGDINQRVHREEGTGIQNPGEEVDELLETGFQTVDPGVKEEVYGEVQEIVMDQAIVLPLYYSEYVVGAYEDVDGIDLRPIPQFTRWTSLEHRKLD